MAFILDHKICHTHLRVSLLHNFYFKLSRPQLNRILIALWTRYCVAQFDYYFTVFFFHLQFFSWINQGDVHMYAVSRPNKYLKPPRTNRHPSNFIYFSCHFMLWQINAVYSFICQLRFNALIIMISYVLYVNLLCQIICCRCRFADIRKISLESRTYAVIIIAMPSIIRFISNAFMMNPLLFN